VDKGQFATEARLGAETGRDIRSKAILSTLFVSHKRSSLLKKSVLGRSCSQNGTEILPKHHKTGFSEIPIGGRKGHEGVCQQPGSFLRQNEEGPEGWSVQHTFL
jgi:hypothetical protein